MLDPVTILDTTDAIDNAPPKDDFLLWLIAAAIIGAKEAVQKVMTVADDQSDSKETEGS